MSTMTDSAEMTTAHAENTKALLVDLWEHIDAGRDFEGQDAREYLDQWPLEIVWELGEPFAVYLGTGGPHIEITGGGRSGGYVLTVYWAGDVAHARGEAITRTGDYFRELVEEQ